MARAFHDAILDVKHAVRTLLKGPYTEEARERLAMIVQRLLRLDPSTLTDVEDVIAALESDQRGPATKVATSADRTRKR